MIKCRYRLFWALPSLPPQLEFFDRAIELSQPSIFSWLPVVDFPEYRRDKKENGDDEPRYWVTDPIHQRRLLVSVEIDDVLGEQIPDLFQTISQDLNPRGA